MAIKSGWMFYVLMNNKYRRFFYYYLCYTIYNIDSTKVVVKLQNFGGNTHYIYFIYL